MANLIRRILFHSANDLRGSCIGATTVRTRGNWSPTFRLGTNNVLMVSQLLGRIFQNARNFTASITKMQDLASEFSKIFWGVIPPTLTAVGATPSRTQHPARPLGAGRKRPGVATQTLVSSTFQPWLRPWAYMFCSSDVYTGSDARRTS